MVTLVTSTAALAALLLNAGPALAGTHNLRIVNGGSHAIKSINISGINQRMWGPDLLGNSFLFPGQAINFTIGQGCLEDIRVIYRDGKVVQRGSFDTCKFDLKMTY